jgi:hypothetical protein
VCFFVQADAGAGSARALGVSCSEVKKEAQPG